MAREEINIGFTPNDQTGTPLRVGGDRINKNFIELYSGVVEVNSNPTTPGLNHVTIYQAPDGRILVKNSDNVVRQIDRYIIKNGDGDTVAETTNLKFDSVFQLSIDDDTLIISLNVDPDGFLIHGNELHDPDFAPEDHDHDGMIHEQNTDSKLAEGTEFEISAEELKGLLDRVDDTEPALPDNIVGWIFPPIDLLTDTKPLSPTEDFRVIDTTDNKIYTWDGTDWVADPIMATNSDVDGYCAKVFDSPNGPNREYIYNHDTLAWIDITGTFVLDLGRFQTNFGLFGNLLGNGDSIRTARPFFGLVNGYSIRSLISSGKYVVHEGMEDLPAFPTEDYEPGMALVEAVVFMTNRLFYWYYRLNTGEVFFQTCNAGVYTEWRKVSSFDNQDFEESNPGLLKTTLAEKNTSLNITSYLADTTTNHVKFILLNPLTAKNKIQTFRHFDGANTMTIERSSGAIYWNGLACNLISSEGDKGFWVTMQSDGENFYIISDSGLTEANVNTI